MAPILGNPAMPNLLAGSVPRNVLRSTSGSAAPAPEIGWENLYTRQVDIFKQEREVWEQERTLLRKEIERLKAQLASDYSKLGANGQLEDGEASDHAHRGHEFPHAAVEPSVGSHTPSSSPPGGRRSPMSRLPSISEDQDSAPVLKSLNGENHFPSIASAIEQGVDQVLKHERPLSPNPTPKHLSPAPASYVKHAGHTPAKLGALSPSESLHSPLHNRHTRDNTDTNGRSAEQLGYDIDDDPPLKGPLALPSTPEHPKAPAMLGELQNKLQEIEHDPDAHKPAVLQGRPAPLDESETKQLASPSENKENEPVLNDDSHMAIKLRKKQSFNFGAPLGKLRP
ncbi:hypothetical protein W97_03753 [Coniosporium apollinis CBS 100218]|uniref:Uncharacterized protein n=1 Tax=Coniosporium apollinis (strain CBS 100218) TaxID=1168221 RepID=R7YRI2_CONA1|nr:uncharacterized protein W97_03753 [Coniosporium apollinis CBS 100218]EON64520.1 hypothetical protein W97_03753 [Coniosporium apollinis CBS 100218]